MRWTIIALPVLTSAQTLSIFIADTLPSALQRWQDCSWRITIASPVPIAVRMLPCIEGEQFRLCARFAQQPVIVVEGSVSFPLSAVLAELLLTAEPLYRRNLLPAGRYRFCVEVVEPTDSLHRLERQCREFTVVGIPPIELLSIPTTIHHNSSELVRFAWQASAPVGNDVRFELRVVEQAEGQSAWHALMTARPVTQCQRAGGGSTMWECSLAPTVFRPGNRYLWGITVQHEGQLELISPIAEFSVE